MVVPSFLNTLKTIDKDNKKLYNLGKLRFKPLRQKKSGICLKERVNYGVSFTKATCIIWTAKGCEEMHRRMACVNSLEYDGTL